jgi:hypothetical protein
VIGLVGGYLRALRTAVRDVVTLGLLMLCSTMHTAQLEEVVESIDLKTDQDSQLKTAAISFRNAFASVFTNRSAVATAENCTD